MLDYQPEVPNTSSCIYAYQWVSEGISKRCSKLAPLHIHVTGHSLLVLYSVSFVLAPVINCSHDTVIHTCTISVPIQGKSDVIPLVLRVNASHPTYLSSFYAK